MATSTERYRAHRVWETLALKREALFAARFDTEGAEEVRLDIIEWLDEAVESKLTRQPALYLGVLDDLSAALNQLTIEAAQFNHMAQYQMQNQAYQQLLRAVRALPLPQPKNLANQYVRLLDKEIEARTERLDGLEASVAGTEQALQDRLGQLNKLQGEAEQLQSKIQAEKQAIATVSQTAADDMNAAWSAELKTWQEKVEQSSVENNAKALERIALLDAVNEAAVKLAAHAAGDLSASDWSARAKRERRAAQWMRAGAIGAFLIAAAVGFFIAVEAIVNNFDISVGGGIMRASLAVVIGAFGGLLLRESSRHFREADTSEDVALALSALAPFYANATDEVSAAARVQVGEAVLVKNLLSRFAHRDAAKHAGEINAGDAPDLLAETVKALKLPGVTPPSS